VKAPGWKLNARAASKWVNPAIMIQPMVTRTPARSIFEIQPMQNLAMEIGFNLLVLSALEGSDVGHEVSRLTKSSA
jgi:hypothetical protein